MTDYLDISHKGPSIKYVRAEGRGVSKKWPIFAYDSTDRLREKRTRGGRGSKIPKNLRTSFKYRP